MRIASPLFIGALLASALVSPLVACSGDPMADGAGGGSSWSGGAASGGQAPSGGAASGGGLTTGGAASGGASSGGAPSGGGPAGGAGVGGAGVGGAGEQTGGAAGVPATFATITNIVAGTIVEGCGSASCHNGEATPHFTNNDMLYDTLLDPTHVADDYCGGLPMITAGNPAQSAFLKAIREGCGTVGLMPRGCKVEDYNCLPTDVIAAVEAWIVAGAPKN